MDELLQELLSALECPTSLRHSLLKIDVTENFSYDDFNDKTIREYFIPPSLVNLLFSYFSTSVFSDDNCVTFTEEDKVSSDFNYIFQYLFSIVYYTIIRYFLFFSLPTDNLKFPQAFKVFKSISSSLFDFKQSHVYFKLYIPLEDCDVSFMYKSPFTEGPEFKKNSLYIIPYTICNNIDHIKGKHILFEFSL